MSMDALFGLCRKKSAGVSVRPPLFSNTFFEDQGRVDEFVTAYDTSDRIVDKVQAYLIGTLYIMQALYINKGLP